MEIEEKNVKLRILKEYNANIFVNNELLNKIYSNWDPILYVYIQQQQQYLFEQEQQKYNEEIVLFHQLKPKMLLENELIGNAIVISSNSPSDFTILPIITKNDGKSTIQIFKKLLEDLSLCQIRKSVNWGMLDSLVKYQLILIQNTNGNKELFRAMVLDDTFFIEDETVSVNVELIDFGIICSVSQKNIGNLPLELLQYPPMGFRCSLHGISSIRHKWSFKAKQFFNECVEGRQLIFHVKKIQECEKASLNLSTFGLVELFFEESTNNFVSVNKYLINNGLGIAWNYF